MVDRNLALEVVRVTEAAALAAATQMGRGDEKMADQVAVDAMRQALNALNINGTVVIGEGERDQAPMLYIGERVGNVSGPKVDIALDPLEGTSITAKGGANALAVIAIADAGGFLNAPDVYMQKIAIGAVNASDVIDIDDTVENNLARLAKAKQTNIPSLTVCILDRPRYQQIIEDVRRAGARIALINDGDVSGVIATAQADSGIDMYIGTGGAPEGVLAAAALRCIGGAMQGRLLFRHEDEKARARKMGIKDFDKVYQLKELADGEVMFAATGVTSGAMLSGIRYFSGGAKSESIVMRSKTKTVRTIHTTHHF
jgi:fructose-1,6-bisphosphatase II / sedoheptulose-1,7-bisphosphatase